MIITRSYPRAALIGNPSDGYFGKTISFTFSNFKAQARLDESKRLEIVPGIHDRLEFTDADDLLRDISANGYYGGVRLVKAAIKKFNDYCREAGIPVARKNFRISYSSDIPVRLGLAGSSAIVTAIMNALLQFYEIEISKPALANLILAVEKDELKIGAGLQDRVAQVYGCPVMMDFDKRLMESRGYGEYTAFDKRLLPSLYIAYRVNLSEGSEVTHNNLAERYAAREPDVLDAIEQWKYLTELVWRKLQQEDNDIGDLLNRNFDIRRKIIDVGRGNIAMVEAARATGASAKFTGSGGAIIGTYNGEAMFNELKDTLGKIGVTVIKPEFPDY